MKVSERSDVVITLMGIRLDIVKMVVPIKSLLKVESKDTLSISERRMRKLASSITTSTTYCFTGEDLPIALLGILTADRSALSSRVNDEYRDIFFTKFDSYRLVKEKLTYNLADVVWEKVSRFMGPVLDDEDLLVTFKGLGWPWLRRFSLR